jgi:hypothetical protein
MRNLGSATARGHLRQRLLVLVERDAVAAIADRVGLDLDAGFQARDRDAQHLFRRISQQARAGR